MIGWNLRFPIVLKNAPAGYSWGVQGRRSTGGDVLSRQPATCRDLALHTITLMTRNRRHSKPKVTLTHWTVMKPTTRFDWSHAAVSERLCSRADLSTCVNFVGRSLKTNPQRFKSSRCHLSEMCLTCMFFPFLLNTNHLQHFCPLLGNTPTPETCWVGLSEWNGFNNV